MTDYELLPKTDFPFIIFKPLHSVAMLASDFSVLLVNGENQPILQ